MASAEPKRIGKNATSQDLILRDGERDVLGKDVEQKKPVATSSGCVAGTAPDRGKRHANTCVGQVDGDHAEDQAERCGTASKKTIGFDGNAAHALQFAMCGNAGDDAAKDERRHDHADQAEKDFAYDLESVPAECGASRPSTTPANIA